MQVRLGDFGIAKDFKCVSALESGSKFAIAGTPLYMAPECMKSEGVGKPADAWSLGIILFEMIHPELKTPFTGETRRGSRASARKPSARDGRWCLSLPRFASPF